MTSTVWVEKTLDRPLPEPEKSWHITMTLIPTPWSRVRTPPPLPRSANADDLNDLDDYSFAELIQAYLVPRDQEKPARRQWDQLWTVLRENDDLADRTYNVLEQFLDTTEVAIENNELDDVALKRARKFIQQCEMSWKRIDRGRDRSGPLGWAGEKATAHPAHSRRVIASLIAAVARHRSEVLREYGKPRAADAELWDVMADLELDPRQYD